jgi:hypothetical protein
VQPDWKRLFGVRIGLLPRHNIPQYGTVKTDTLALVTDYYDWTTYEHATVPATYSELDRDWESPVIYFEGESESDVLRLSYAYNKVEAALRHATSGGHFDPESVDWLLGPFVSIVQGSERDVAMAPIVEEFDTMPADETAVGCFTRDGDGRVESLDGYALSQ